MTHSTGASKPLPDLRRGLISVVVGLGVYYGARYLGATPLEALLFSTTASALRLAYSACRARTFDPIAGFLMTADGITLIVGLLSRSPTVTMLGQHIPGVVFQVFVFVGLARNRPITESLLAWLRPDWAQLRVCQHDQHSAEARIYHRLHMRLTLAVATAGLIHLIVAAVVIFAVPVDVAQATLGLLALATDGVILVVVIGGIGRFIRIHSQTVRAV
ncbi:VC0807 family protein [Mycolicibacterium helvum]|uniref:Uncharacterized protein n=1 Tax=Mycolicibacterium helvum TaxID=1534349 RepID=A0A7I7TF52_9MYCO|nr:VC0807 family protein [Mycolicibacterium helvum]BBY67738.1 hypothetical protein MHEL_59810 [Mycolicibacterium helvum]